MPRIGIDEWLAELETIRRHQPEGFTSLEVAQALKISGRSMQEKMRGWFAAGLIEHVGFREGMSIDGKRKRSPIYRLVKKKKRGNA